MIDNPYGGPQRLRLPNNPLDDIDWASEDVFADYLALRDQMNEAKAAHDAAAKELSAHRQREADARQRKEHLAEQGTTEEDYDAMIEADRQIRRLEFVGRDLAGRKAVRLREYQAALEKFQRYDYAMKMIEHLKIGTEKRIHSIQIEQSHIEDEMRAIIQKYQNMLNARQNSIDQSEALLATITATIERLKEAGLYKDSRLNVSSQQCNAEALKMVGQR